MEEHRRTWFDDDGLVLAGPPGEAGAAPRHVPFYGAAMHYWRTPRAAWRRCLDGLARLGVTVVESYVPWSVHERADRSYDWTGDRDLGAWLDAVAAAGLVAALRPGPHINAELTFFGFPERVLRDPEIQARGNHGGPVWLPAPPRGFPVPSYASEKFHDEVEGWFGALAEIVRPRLWPDGPVVALQIDNEAQMFFRLGAFDHDYHPDAIAWWHLRHEAPPPRTWTAETAAVCAAWVRFKDAYLAHALGRFAVALDVAGLGGVAHFGNLPPGEPWFADLAGLERAVGGPVGIDVYASAAGLDTVRRRGLHLVGSTASVPLVPELGTGFVPYLLPFEDDDQRAVTLTLLAAGVRGLSFYMGVNRDRWVGGALDASGNPLPAARWIAPILAALAALDWTRLRRVAPVALVCSRADVRHGLASSLLDPLPPIVGELLGLGPAGSAELGRDPAAITHRRWFAAVAAALDLARVPYVIVDESAGLDRFLAARAIVVPTQARVDRTLWRTLKQAADARRVIVLGPEMPTVDELGQPLGDDLPPPRKAGLMQPGSLDDLAGLAADLAALAPPEAWFVERPSSVHAHAFAQPGDGAVRAVFLVHPADRRHIARLVVPTGTRLRDVLDQARFSDEGEPGIVAIPVGPHDARMLIVE